MGGVFLLRLGGCTWRIPRPARRHRCANGDDTPHIHRPGIVCLYGWALDELLARVEGVLDVFASTGTMCICGEVMWGLPLVVAGCGWVRLRGVLAWTMACAILAGCGGWCPSKLAVVWAGSIHLGTFVWRGTQTRAISLRGVGRAACARGSADNGVCGRVGNIVLSRSSMYLKISNVFDTTSSVECSQSAQGKLIQDDQPPCYSAATSPTPLYELLQTATNHYAPATSFYPLLPAAYAALQTATSRYELLHSCYQLLQRSTSCYRRSTNRYEPLPAATQLLPEPATSCYAVLRGCYPAVLPGC
ncbi:hypothetical protein B0H17DRAFT_1196781 [Mycena rosella]|uniref:Uncharacterized protein n=1 Tax=Mycena rosella TaxID=1033263 RepID=A0AAD7GK26_MYCRO|nr:hypothetical protein B0H17DRAFT_1196781 [Mycena rosella]